MALKTILVHVEPSLRPSECIKVAAQLAIADHAHLVGVSTTGLSALTLVGTGLNPGEAPLASQLDASRADARDSLAAFESQARSMGVTSVESRLVHDEPGSALVSHGRYADLIVVGQTRADGAPVLTVRKDFPEYLLLNGARPLLMVPARGSFDTLGARILVAWNGSLEATRALTFAMSLLQWAQAVMVMLINPGSDGMDEGVEPGADVGLYLARHGVRAEVTIKIGDEHDLELLDAISECKADLLVMGAYGHSRLREYLLGGATRTILRSMTVPVWMAH